MNAPLILVLKAAFSKMALQAVYEDRKTFLPPQGVRSRVTIAVCLVLLSLAVILLIATAWVPTNGAAYLKSRNGIYFVTAADVAWKIMTPVKMNCSFDESCYKKLQNEIAPTNEPIQTLDKFKNNSNQSVYTMLRAEISTAAFKIGLDEPVTVIALPRFRYRTAKVLVNGIQHATFLKDDLISVSVPTVMTKGNIVLDTIFEFPPSDKTVAGVRDHTDLLIGTQSEFQRYQDYLAGQRTRAVGAMGHLAKIVLALFCLLLFLIVDGSPDSLGLALFMGFEAVAMGTGMGWLPLGWLGIERPHLVTNFCYQMGDILKLYFLLQMARVGRPNVVPWLVVGVLLSIPYAIFMDVALNTNLSWAYKIPRSRDTFVGLVGALYCLRALWSIRHITLPWRKMALAVASLAALGEVANSWIAHSDIQEISPLVQSTFTIFQANIGYLFALSTFLNISTLENRVRSLMVERDKSNEMKRQMELGREVQKAFHTLPQLPPELSLTCHLEAAAYVSGDTYFVAWDRKEQVLTFLLNDVTGHGVQAAMKAFASNMIARTIWSDANQSKLDIDRRKNDRRRHSSKLEQYDVLIDQLLCHGEEIPDFNAMIGAEFNLETGFVSIYRANYNFPVLVEQEIVNGKAEWTAKLLPVPNRHLAQYEMKKGSFLLLVSDGFLNNARSEADFTQHIVKFLSGSHQSAISPESLQTEVLSWFRANTVGKPDDRTMLVFHWLPDAAVRGLKSGLTKVGNSDILPW